jgi:hypothetical protein
MSGFECAGSIRQPIFRSFMQTSLNPHAAARYGSPLISTAQITRAFLLATTTVGAVITAPLAKLVDPIHFSSRFF